MRNQFLLLFFLFYACSAAFSQEAVTATASSTIDPAGESGRVKFRKRFSDTEHYPAIAAYLKSEDLFWGPGPGGHGRETIINLPKEVGELVASRPPGELFSYLVAYFDHPETYKLYRIRDLVMLALSRQQPSALISWHIDKVPDEQIRCFEVPNYLATPLYRDLPKSEKKADWISYFNGLRVWGIVPL